MRIDPDTHRITGTVNLGGQGIHALFAAGRDLLVLTDLGRVIVVRGYSDARAGRTGIHRWAMSSRGRVGLLRHER